MAVIKFISGKRLEISGDAALKLWEVLNAEREPTEKEGEYCGRIESLYMNWRTAPDSYLRANKRAVSRICKSEWMVDGYKVGDWKHGSRGIAVRPEPNDYDNWRVSELLGLIKDGEVTWEGQKV